MLHKVTVCIIIVSPSNDKEAKMPEHLKAAIGSQNKLQELLDCSRTQAWRIWTGKSALTPINEKYLWRVLQDA